MNAQRYPLGPLADALGIELGLQLGGAARWDPTPQPQGTAAIAEAAGVTVRRVRFWKEHGLSEQHADEAACTIGLHPCEIWPEWFDQPNPEELRSTG